MDNLLNLAKNVNERYEQIAKGENNNNQKEISELKIKEIQLLIELEKLRIQNNNQNNQMNNQINNQHKIC